MKIPFISLLLCGCLALLLSAQATPILTIDPPLFVAGSTLHLSASGWKKDKVIDVTFSGPQFVAITLQADGAGSFDDYFDTLPFPYIDGLYTITACQKIIGCVSGPFDLEY